MTDSHSRELSEIPSGELNWAKTSHRMEGRRRLLELEAAAAVFYGDAQHPSWADYLATNLLDALTLVPDTGDWYGALKAWCERTKTGLQHPNRAPGQKERNDG